VDAIWALGSGILFSALTSGAGVSAEETVGAAGGVNAGEVAGNAVAGREVAAVAAVRASFAAGGEVAPAEADVREGVSAGAVPVTVDGEDAAVIDVEVRDAFSVDGAVATVVDEVVDGGTALRNVFSAGGTVVTVVDAVPACDEGEVRGSFSPGGAVATVDVEPVTAEFG